MDQQCISFKYIFRLADGSEEFFPICLNSETLEILPDAGTQLPEWTTLNFKKCPHCALAEATVSHCPAAANLAPIVERCDRLFSIDPIDLTVITEERRTSQKTTAQKAIGSLMGLMIAASSCPQAAFFKPMARFHLPMATEDETIFRATATYMLAQYFVYKDGGSADFSMEGLSAIYRKMQDVNMAMADRLRASVKTDASINAIVLLDMYAKAMPYVIKQSLEEIRYLFEPFLAQKDGSFSTEP